VLVIASQNEGKVREIAALPGAAGLKLSAIREFAGCPDIAEDGTTFEENAAIKAVKYSLWLKRRHGIWPPVAAEDAGLSLEGLLGWPGVLSARIAEGDDERIDLVLQQAQGLASRAARFTAVTAVAVNGILIRTFAAHVPGRITQARTGVGGFGYDPIFEEAASGRTFAQMTPQEKNEVSHRGRSWIKLFEFVKTANLAAAPVAETWK
jgi:XTP/dITP diphosphohydrolase